MYTETNKKALEKTKNIKVSMYMSIFQSDYDNWRLEFNIVVSLQETVVNPLLPSKTGNF